jgi:hypothetical protein
MSSSRRRDAARTPEAMVPDTIVPAESVDGVVTLRISGGKPIRMRAELVAEASSWMTGATAWHELTLYRRESSGFAVGIKTCRGTAGINNVFHAQIFADLDAALTWLEEFDPTADLDVDIDASDRSISTTDIALRAAALRQRADRLDLQYRSMIGELLYRLDADG